MTDDPKEPETQPQLHSSISSPNEPAPPHPDQPQPKVESPDPKVEPPDPVTGRPATEQPPDQAPTGTETHEAHEEHDPADTDDPDQLEDEIDEATEEGDIEPRHRGTTTRTASHKRSKSKR